MDSERRITKLEVQKSNPNRASVYVDGSFAFGIHQDLIIRFNLHAGRTLSIPEQQEIEAAEAELKARDVALDYLAHKPRTEGELRRRLARSEYQTAVIGAVIDRLSDLGYLDDEQYAQDYVRARFENRGYGPFRIRKELQERGVGEVLIDQALAQLEPEEVLSAARNHAAKKQSRLPPDDPAHQRQQKLTGYLRRRGFNFDVTRRVLRELGEE